MEELGEKSGPNYNKRINVLGFLEPRTEELHALIIEGRVDSEVVVGCFESFSQTREGSTIVRIDNAPVHTSGTFTKHLPFWQKRGLFIGYHRTRQSST